MTTVINSPAPTTDSGGNGFLIGVIVLIGFVVIFLYFGLPAIRQARGPAQINIPPPQVNIPGKIDVNVNQAK